jgi:replicative DNA helicase
MASIGYEKHVHYDVELEAGVLGATLLEKNAFAKVSGILTAECFYSTGNRIVFEVIENFWRNNHPLDLLLIVPAIYKKGIRDIEGLEPALYVTKLTNAVISSANIEAHCLKIREFYAERKLWEIKSQPNRQGLDTIKKVELLQKELDSLLKMQAQDDWHSMVDIVMELIGHMERVKDLDFIGLPTGFRAVDSMTGGLVDQTQTVIAARPSVGKTAFMMDLVLHQALLGIPVGIVSLETPKLHMGARFAAKMARTEFFRIFRSRFETKEQKDAVHQYLAMLADLPIYITDTVGVNILDIKSKAAQLIYKHKVKIIFIDYLQLVEDTDPNKNYNREQQVAKISKQGKLMAMEFGIPTVLLAQLSRETEKTADKKPQAHHLRESGAIEQDADGIMLLHRDFKSGILTYEDGTSTKNDADLIIAKWRNGDTGSFKIGFNGEQMRFYDKETENELFQRSPGGLFLPADSAF